MAKSVHPELGRVPVTTVLGALSDPIRLGVVRLLADDTDGVVERQWGELDAPVAKSTLSHHMKVLRDSGLTRTRQEGTRCFVRLRREELNARFPGLLDDVLAAIGDTDPVVTLKTAKPS